jgi:inner membrane protein
VFFSFHLHLLGDVVGARGPDGYQWPLVYLWPFSDKWLLTWKGQWQLDAWPNFLITMLALFFTFYLAWNRGFSPVGIFSKKADNAFVETLRNRFPYKKK